MEKSLVNKFKKNRKEAKGLELHVRINQEMHDWLLRIATKADISVSEVARGILEGSMK